jgi:phage-related protein
MAIELTRLGVVIDPTGAQQGAKAATAAADTMARAMVDDLNKVEAKSKKAGQTVKVSGDVMEQAARETRQEFERLGKTRGFEGITRGVATSMGDIRSTVINALDALGLLDNRIGMLVRRGDSLIQAGGQMGRVLGDMGGGAQRAGTGMAGLVARFAPLLAGLAAIAAAIALVVVGFVALKKGIEFTGEAINEAAALEQYSVRLAVLTGSMEKATEKLKELNAFADSTQFTDAEIFNAGTKLEAMTRGALSTTDALKAIGGAAFVAGKEFNDIADLTGRLYNNLRLGMDFIEPLKTMSSYGVITGETVKEVIRLGEEAEASGNKTANFAQQWATIYADLQTKQQALELASNTWDGMLSTISGKWDAVKASFGEPIMDALKPVLTAMIALLKELLPLAETLGEAVGSATEKLLGLLATGKIGRLLGEALIAGFADATLFFLKSFTFAIDAMTTDMEASVVPFANALIDAAERFVNFMIEGVGRVANALDAINPAKGTGVVDFTSGLLGKAGVFGKDATPNDINLPGTAGAGLGAPRTGLEPVNFTRLDANAASDITERFDTFIRELDPYARTKQVLDESQGFYDAVLKKKEVEINPVDATPSELGTGMDAAAAKRALDEAQRMNDMMNDRLTAGREESEILQAHLNFDMARVRELENEAEIRHAITQDMREANPGLANQIEEQIRLNQAMRDQLGPMQEIATAWLDLKSRGQDAMAGITQSITGDVSNAISAAISGTKSWKEAFSDLGASVINTIIQMITQMWVQYTVGLLLKSVMGGIFGGGAGAVAAVAHTGGQLTGAPTRQIQRFHTGGKATSERLAMLEDGETVLTAEQGAAIRDRLRKSASRQSSGGATNRSTGQEVTIMNVQDPNQVSEAIAANPDIILNAINKNLPAVKRMLGTNRT